MLITILVLPSPTAPCFTTPLLHHTAPAPHPLLPYPAAASTSCSLPHCYMLYLTSMHITQLLHTPLSCYPNPI